MNSRRRLSYSLAAFVLLAGALALAQTKRPMTLLDVLDVPHIMSPQVSPDGRQVLFVMEKADWTANHRISHIWRVSADGSNPVQMTSGDKGESNPRWSPDGRMIALVAQRGIRDAEAQIYLMDNSGGEARRLSEHVSSVEAISWSPDGGSIYFLAAEARTAEERERDKAKDDVFGFDEDYKQKHLWKINTTDGKEQRITSGDYSVVSYAVSRDGRRIVWHRAPTPLYGTTDQSEVWVMDADGGNTVQLTRNSVQEDGARLSPDDSQVLFLAQANEKFDTYYNRKIFLMPAGGGRHRVLTADLPYEVEWADWSKDGQAILFIANMGVHSEMFRLDLASGRFAQLTSGDHAVAGDYDSASDRLVLTVDEPTNPGEVWMLAPTGGTPVRVTHMFDYLAARFLLPQQEKVQWKGADGATVEGVLFYPIDYRPGQRYALAVQTHGGPQASDKFGFGYWMNYVQVLTAKGYVVLHPNYRGSTGYGDVFLRDMVGHYFQNAHLDVMAGVDHVIKMGVADPERMVKMGWSGGGHMTNKIITFTDRFKAAASGAGASNWISMYAQSDVRSYRTPWFGGTPWQNDMPFAVYWDNSPLKYVANVKTPTIFLVGEKDVRVPMPQSVEMYRALKSNGIPTHLYVAPREPHGWDELRHDLFKMNVELDWFEKYATKRPYTWEKAPDDKNDTKTTTTTGR